MFINLEQLINLSAVPGVGPTRIRSLAAHFKNVESIFESTTKVLCAIDGVDLKTARHILDYKDFKFGEAQVKKAAQLGVEIISFWDNRYPENLKKIYDPPAFIFVKGELNPNDRFAIGVVGTRLASSYGKVIAEKFSKELAKKGLTVVSGMARGIDTISHWAAIHAGGRTFAILGSALDKIYPAENTKLADKIMSQGALISEFYLGTGPDAVNFPRRNRIIAGLSLGTVVIEAGIRSGALLTANYALEQNREVFAVPGNVNSPKSSGTNQLIKEGAKLTASVDDILAELEPQLKFFLNKEEQNSREKLEDLSEAEKKLLRLLSHEPIHIDKLSHLIGKSTAETLSLLLPLEFKDLVKQLQGKMFIKE